MTALLTQTTQLTGRELRALLRQPIYIAFTLVQPMLWLLLFGALFRSVAQIPGFDADQSYLTFLAPGVVAMTALFSSAWTGTGFVEEMERGVLQRFLASPARRGALISARLANAGVVAVVQTLIVLGVAIWAGARFEGGLPGILVTVLTAVLITAAFGALSCALALLTGQQDTLIGVSQFLVLPLQFLSSALIALQIAPGWIRDVARFNPMEWAVAASREALGATPDWTLVLRDLGLLAALALLLGFLATRAFRAHQRSL